MGVNFSLPPNPISRPFTQRFPLTRSGQFLSNFHSRWLLPLRQNCGSTLGVSWSLRDKSFFFTLSEGHCNKPCNFEDHSVAKVQKKICPCCHPKVSAICRPFFPYFLTFDVFSVYLPELHERRGRPGEVPCLLEELELVISESAVMQKTSLLHHAILPLRTTFDGSKLVME